MAKNAKGLMERLKAGDMILVAEGYDFYFESRGYLSIGGWFPLVTLEHPDVVKSAYRDFVHAGSDVVEAFTYYATRERLRMINMDDKVELINREALRMAREVADETGTLLAGNICNTNVYHADSPDRNAEVKAMFKDMVQWSLDYDVDFIIGETFKHFGEAMMALEAIKEYAQGVPAVITLGIYSSATKDGEAVMFDGVPVTEACKRLEEAGADVVGLNCSRGPATMMPIMRKVRKVCKGPLAALPVPYRTTLEEPTFCVMIDKETGKNLYPRNREVRSCAHEEIEEFGKECRELGIQYVGLCCGNRPSLTRSLAESLGRKPPASRYSMDLSTHVVYGTHSSLKKDCVEENLAMFCNKPEA